MTMQPQLVEVLDAHRFDQVALLKWLQQTMPDIGESLDIRQFQGGQSNPTFMLTTAKGQYVLRKNHRERCCHRRIWWNGNTRSSGRYPSTRTYRYRKPRCCAKTTALSGRRST